MQDRLNCLVLHLEDLDDLIERDGHITCEEDLKEARFQWLFPIREALELIGLALHYDPLAWNEFLHPVEWDASSIDNPLMYDASQLQPLFHIKLQEGLEHNDDFDFELLCDFLLEIDSDTMSDAYKDAKARLKRVVNTAGLYYDEDYRVPVQFDVIPDRFGGDQEPAWSSQLRNLVWGLNGQRGDARSAVQLVSIRLLCWDSSADAWLIDLLTKIRLANVTISAFSLPSGGMRS